MGGSGSEFYPICKYLGKKLYVVDNKLQILLKPIKTMGGFS